MAQVNLSGRPLPARRAWGKLDSMSQTEREWVEAALPFESLDEISDFFSDEDKRFALTKEAHGWGEAKFVPDLLTNLFAPWILRIVLVPPR